MSSILRVFKSDGIKLEGLYRGKVVDSDDPLKLGRVKVRVYPFMVRVREEDLPWAEPCWVGKCYIPQPENWVWVMFVEGDISRPVWMGWSVPFDEEGSGIEYVPEARGTVFDRQNFIAGGIFAEENAEYPEADCYRHRSGSRMIFFDSGKILIKSGNGGYVIIDNIVEIGPQLVVAGNLKVNGNADILGDLFVGGDLTVDGEIIDI